MEKYRKINGGHYTGERALFMLNNAIIEDAYFHDGESPLKEGVNLEINRCNFAWKYPLWYTKNVIVKDSKLELSARSGVWYVDNIVMEDCQIDAPKTFRRSNHIFIKKCSLINADETLWSCKNVRIESSYAKGDYFLMNAENIEINRLELDGNYLLDGAKNVTVRDSVLNSKDAFWNTEDVTVINSKIDGEYLGWNSKNLTFINCEISSLQALCYIKGLKLINCKLTDSTLCLEYCENIDATIIDRVKSIKNPTSGVIRLFNGLDELIVDENSRAKNKDDLKIISGNGYEI